MSLQYKMMGKTDNLNPEEKKKRGYYPTVVRKRTIGIAELAQNAAQGCSLSTYEMEMAMKVALKTIQDELLKSNNVCLEGFGTFSIKAGSRHVETPDELRAESIFVKKVAFKCSPILLKNMRAAKFIRVSEK